jgi:hypothetical protein
VARDGQGARDYGAHLVAEAQWELYGNCPTCYVYAGQPCIDLRYKSASGKTGKVNWTRHLDRPLLPVVNAATVVRRMVQPITQNEKRQALWALNSVSLPGTYMSGRARWNLVAPCKFGKLRITTPQVHKPWGRATHQSGYLSHIVGGLLFVWLDGRLIMTQIRYRCNSRSQAFRLMDEPDSQICPACKIERVPRERPT